MMQDLRDGWRALRASPLVSVVAVLSLALGIGANTAIFSLVDGLLLRSLPVRDPERLVLLEQSGDHYASWTFPIWEAVQSRGSQLFDGLTAFAEQRFDLARGGQTQFVNGVYASGTFFDVLGIHALAGRTFTEEDDRRHGGPAGPVVVISYRLWQQRFGGSPNAVGQTLSLDRVPFTVIGVLPKGFLGPSIGVASDVFIPLGTEPLITGADTKLDHRGYWFLDIMARLKRGRTIDESTRAIEGVRWQIRTATLPTDWRPEEVKTYLTKPLVLERASAGDAYLRDSYSRPLLTVFLVVVLVLLIACGNIANLMLARAIARRHEMSVRLALGASRVRLARQLLAESLVLTACGAALGLLFALWGSRALIVRLSPDSKSIFLDLSLDWRMLAFTSALVTLTTILFGIAPALRAARADPNDALKSQGRGTGGQYSLLRPLVVGQVALTLVLLVAAALFTGTLWRLVSRDLGFDRNSVLVVNVNAAKSRAHMEQRALLYERATSALSRVPGVALAAASMVTPVSNYSYQFQIDAAGLSERQRGTYVNYVTPGFFATYGTRLLAGRDFTDRDRAGTPGVAVVNETFARRFLTGRNAVGASVKRSGGRGHVYAPMEVVGLVRDAVYRDLRQPVPPTIYVPLPQQENIPPHCSISIRASAGPPALLTRGAAEAIGRVDPDLSLTFRTLSQQIADSLVRERLIAMLSGFFGLLALLLAGIGLYGVTSYTVARQRSEIGIRIALGAAPGTVARAVVKRTLGLVALGVLTGGAISVWAARFVTALLYGLQPHDAATFAGAAALLTGIAALAAWLPARRAARIDPASVLRE